MRAYELAENLQVTIPAGRSRRVTYTVPRYWYHNLGGRTLNSEGGIDPYVYGRETALLTRELYREPQPTALIYLSPKPLYSGALKIDLAKLDTSLVRLTGQVEGYAVYGEVIPAEAIVA